MYNNNIFNNYIYTTYFAKGHEITRDSRKQIYSRHADERAEKPREISIDA